MSKVMSNVQPVMSWVFFLNKGLISNYSQANSSKWQTLPGVVLHTITKTAFTSSCLFQKRVIKLNACLKFHLFWLSEKDCQPRYPNYIALFYIQINALIEQQITIQPSQIIERLPFVKRWDICLKGMIKNDVTVSNLKTNEMSIVFKIKVKADIDLSINY